MIPPLAVSVRPIKGGRFRATVADLNQEATLIPNPGDRWSMFAAEFHIDRRSFDQAASAAARLVGENVQRMVYEALVAAHGEAEAVAIETSAA